MKECPKCGIIYPDSENYCMECGKKLKLKEFATIKPQEFVSLASQVAELASGLNDVKNALAAIRVPELPEDITNLPAIKELSKEFLSLASRTGELETGLEELRDRMETIRHPELPEDITEISKHTKELRKLKEFVKETRSVLKSLQKATDKNVKLMARIEGKFADFKSKMGDMVANIETRADARISGLEQEVSALRAAQEKLEIDKIKGAAVSVESRVSDLESRLNALSKELDALKGKLGTLAKSMAEKPLVFETDRLKREIVRDILRELKGVVG